MGKSTEQSKNGFLVFPDSRKQDSRAEGRHYAGRARTKACRASAALQAFLLQSFLRAAIQSSIFPAYAFVDAGDVIGNILADFPACILNPCKTACSATIWVSLPTDRQPTQAFKITDLE